VEGMSPVRASRRNALVEQHHHLLGRQLELPLQATARVATRAKVRTVTPGPVARRHGSHHRRQHRRRQRCVNDPHAASLSLRRSLRETPCRQPARRCTHATSTPTARSRSAQLVLGTLCLPRIDMRRAWEDRQERLWWADSLAFRLAERVPPQPSAHSGAPSRTSFAGSASVQAYKHLGGVCVFCAFAGRRRARGVQLSGVQWQLPAPPGGANLKS
jgi:hypothetical protein